VLDWYSCCRQKLANLTVVTKTYLVLTCFKYGDLPFYTPEGMYYVTTQAVRLSVRASLWNLWGFYFADFIYYLPIVLYMSFDAYK